MSEPSFLELNQILKARTIARVIQLCTAYEEALDKEPLSTIYMRLWELQMAINIGVYQGVILDEPAKIYASLRVHPDNLTDWFFENLVPTYSEVVTDEEE